MSNAIKSAEEKSSLGEIGKAIQETIESCGFSPVINLGGHEMKKYDLHAGINIPNVSLAKQEKLSKGLYAIEPFATNGVGKIEEGKDSGIYKLQGIKNVRNQMTKKILDYIEKEYKTLPFTSRWLYKKFPEFNVNFALKILERDGMLYHYKQLPEKSKGLVSQFEHTLLVNDKVEILTKQ